MANPVSLANTDLGLGDWLALPTPDGGQIADLLQLKVDKTGGIVPSGGTQRRVGALWGNLVDDVILAVNSAPGRVTFPLGPDIVDTDIELGAEWGSASSIVVTPGSKESRGSFQITAAGVGFAADPALRLTFPGGAYATAPFALAQHSGGSVALRATGSTCSTTQLILTWSSTPVLGATYIFTWMLR